ncbi:poly-beta-1,6-N-acetyl-D-glucosamine N-deacetylase [Abditibacteriota bacterium]|nr:poly-beta-1,6-N-acetyl-D-glucosamine N-deacetylase [Abditibacteriota bacterium]
MRVSFLLLAGTGLALSGCVGRTSTSVKNAAVSSKKPGKSGTATQSSPPLLKPKPGAKFSKNGLAVLTWHRIAERPDQYTVTPPAKFADELAFLHEEGANVMRLEDAVRMVKAGQPLPERAVALGFDDGFKSCYTEVFPLLKRYNWPATLYIYPDWISTGAGALTWDELKEMQKSGLVDVQSHTMGHPDLVRMRPKHGMNYEQRLRHELFDSKKTIETKLGTKVTQLAYPYGFYNKHIMAETQKAGYDSAWTVNAAPFRARFGKGETWMSLPRYLIYRNTKIDRFTRYAFGKPLDVSRAYPAANSTITNPVPTISVRIDEAVDPRSVQMRLAIIQKVNAKYNPKTRVLSYTPMEELREGTWTVSISARDKKGQQKTAAWAFVIKSPDSAATLDSPNATP